MVFDPAGESSVGATFDPSDAPLLVEAAAGAGSGLVWLALCRRLQQLTGHDLRGKVLWTRQIPWEGWSLVRVGQFGLVTSADGRALAFDRSGSVRWEGPPSGSSNDAFAVDEQGAPLRISRKGVHLICTTLDGRVRWRAVCDEALGPFAAGLAGVAVMIGHSLAWFGTDSRDATPLKR
jgi:hypothetical protein